MRVGAADRAELTTVDAAAKKAKTLTRDLSVYRESHLNPYSGR